MHNPQTVAFEIKYPWRAYRRNDPRCKDDSFFRTYRKSFITIWHIDPERDGSDDSCDWFGRKLTAKEKEFAAHLIDNEYDNLRHFFSVFISAPCDKHENREDCYDANCHLGDFSGICQRDQMKQRIRCIFAAYKRNFRWRYPVRWHFWHWRFQVHPTEQFKRWAFSKCSRCGSGFKWGESPISGSWDSDGPRWLRSERNIWHQSCDPTSVPCGAGDSNAR